VIALKKGGGDLGGRSGGIQKGRPPTIPGDEFHLYDQEEGRKGRKPVEVQRGWAPGTWEKKGETLGSDQLRERYRVYRGEICNGSDGSYFSKTEKKPFTSLRNLLNPSIEENNAKVLPAHNRTVRIGKETDA